VIDGAALQVLLDRSAAEARRALHTGRFEVAFFEILDLRFNKVVLLFDMRGFVQVFCMNNPCVDICQPESVDGGSGEAGVTILDAGIGEAAGGGVMDASVK